MKNLGDWDRVLQEMFGVGRLWLGVAEAVGVLSWQV